MPSRDDEPCSPTMSIGSSTGERGATIPEASSGLEHGTRVGRFVVVGTAGHGGMGVVYAAYDPELDRKIALKLLRVEGTDSTSASQGRIRLQREAQAMARLSHPNVVTVHDVGVFGDQVFLAMEFVEGQTLKEWLEEKPRSWREVLEVLKHAGEGLAAAHAAGIIHRDFKPSNVLIGKDGRVRVTDFGLARAAKGGDVAAAAEAKATEEQGDRPLSLDTPLTRVGTFVGTPGYMGPEQYEGHEVDARTDQYGFCATLYEALYGKRPFEGDTIDALSANVFGGRVEEAPKESKVPAWVRRVVLRGLAVEAGQRYADMRGLLDVLEKDPAIARRKWSLAAASLLIVAALALGGWRWMKRQGQLCKGADRNLVGVWDAGRKTAVQEAIKKTGASYAADTWTRVSRVLDGYAANWVAMYTDSCEATQVRGEQSATLLDLRVACLEGRLKELRALVDVFAEADATVVEKAGQAASSLPRLSRCADKEALTAAIAPPEDEATRRKVEELRDKLIRAKALEDAGKFPEELELATTAAASAKQLNYAPVEAEALFRLGSLQEKSGKFEAAEQTLREAWWAAETANHGEIEAKAANDLAWVIGVRQGRSAEAEQVARHAGAIAKRLKGAQEIEGDWHHTIGTVLWLKGDFSEAREHLERGLNIREKVFGPEHPAVASSLNNLGILFRSMGEYDKSVQRHERGLAIREKTLGPEHPHVAASLANLGAVLGDMGEYEKARECNERALAIRVNALGPEHPDVAMSLNNSAAGFKRQGKYDEAQRYYERALAIWEKVLGPEHFDVARSLNNLGKLFKDKGEYEKARDYFGRSLAIREKALGPEHPDGAESLNDLGDLFAEIGEYDKAQRYCERALALWEKALGPVHPLVAQSVNSLGEVFRRKGEYAKAQQYGERALSICRSEICEPEIVASAAYTLARVLWHTGHDRGRAVTLGAQARDAYAKLPDRKKELAEVEAWLARHRE